ncbi:MAG: trehalose/maltose transport system permease protein, partial [Actinomycetota bacterium]|nr:trehalose/maltose transport system permease protein [Actinomycetota bacterium]
MSQAGTTVQQRFSWATINTIVILVAAIPIMWLASLSLKDPSTIADGSFIPKDWTLENYKGIFSSSLFTRALINSLGIALIATVLAVVLGSMAAYAIARLSFPGKKLLVAAAL